ncbi:MAG TPA: hypothetical protein VKC57_11115, partial [Ktedonobacterales bacterium]|nr:hypothetical protein [Ktedonobacterales bacterium]
GGVLSLALAQLAFALHLGGTLTSCGSQCGGIAYPAGSFLGGRLYAMMQWYGTGLAVVGLGILSVIALVRRPLSRRTALPAALAAGYVAFMSLPGNAPAILPGLELLLLWVGAAFVSIADRDKAEALPILAALGAAGYRFYATAGTAALLRGAGLDAETVNRISEQDRTIVSLIRTRTVQLVINTITGGTGRMREGIEIQDGFQIRRAAVEASIPCLTSLDTARAVVETLRDASGYNVLPLRDYRQG